MSTLSFHKASLSVEFLCDSQYGSQTESTGTSQEVLDALVSIWYFFLSQLHVYKFLMYFNLTKRLPYDMFSIVREYKQRRLSETEPKSNKTKMY